jgi:drug/metabolite transporter (DMT)-like permease
MRFNKNAFWIASWVINFTVSMSLSKMLSKEIHGFTLLFIRYFFGFSFFLPIALSNISFQKIFKTSKIIIHLIRAFCVLLATFFTYLGYRNLPLPFATTIGFSSPLITTVLAVIFLSEKINYQKVIAILLGYSGILIILNPKSDNFNWYALSCILANLFASISVIISKDLTKSENSFTILIYPLFISFIVSGFIAPFFWITPSLKDIVIISLMGFFATFSQFSYIKALKVFDASYVAPFEYTRILLAIPIGYIFFNEVVDLYTLIGGLMIIIGIYVLAKANKI